MIVFSLEYALALIMLSAFLPGALIVVSAFRKGEFSLLEKILAGCALGMVFQGFLPFAEGLLGINFTYTLALANTALLYIIALGLFFYTRAYEDVIALRQDFAGFAANPLKYAIPAIILLIFALNFFVRIQSLSPIFEELDPYYYMDIAQQVINFGYQPFNDGTAWYPMVVQHRGVPFKAYLEATWYSLYNGGTEYNNYILSLIANIHPPFAAAFAAFFLYLGLRAWYKREYALIASAVASFIPIFIFKLMAGEAEVQPYGFFGLSIFLAFFLWAQKKQDFKLMFFAGIGYMATSLGSSSELVAAVISIIFIGLQAVSMFLTKRDMGQFARVNAVFMGMVLLTAVLKSVFIASPVISYAAIVAALVAFVWALFILQKYSKLDFEMQTYALGGIFVVGLLLFAFTPLGTIFKGVALSSLQFAQYNAPLDRTIAEQGTSGSVFEPSLGFVGKIFDHGIWLTVSFITYIPSAIANFVFSAFSSVLSAIFGVTLAFDAKENSVVMVLLFLAMCASIYSMYRFFIKKEETPVWLFIALIFPVSLVGLIKAKYVIYLGFVVSASLAFILGELELLIAELLGRFKMENAEELKKHVFTAFIIIGFAFAVFQFAGSTDPNDGNSPIAIPLIKAGMGVRFQDNPLALQSKFKDMCEQLKLKNSTDANICAAAADPVGYANKSINNQYNQNLCFYSLIKDPFAGADDTGGGAGQRCGRIAPYWIESMEWIRYNTENGSRITSWWDYGHWENFFGLRNAVIRNEHANQTMIGNIAYDYIIGTPEDLKADMKKYDSKYALFDGELLLSGSSFGGKYGALNYLGCAYANLTNVNKTPGTSDCETGHLWVQIYIPASPQPSDECTISYDQKGITALVPELVSTPQGMAYNMKPRFCVGQTTLVTGEKSNALYELDNRSADGSLKMNKAFINPASQDGRWNVFTLLYTNDLVWIDNGTVKSGMEDAASGFYTSNLYRAYILEDLPGFKLVYKTSDGAVKIYKIIE